MLEYNSRVTTSTKIAIILTFVFSLTSCGQPAEIQCTAADPDEYGNVVNWCDDGSNWWIDSDTGKRFDMDASGNITTTEAIDVKVTSP